MSESNVLFISHANPEDNYFAGWLTTKLLLLGYEVWCDVENLGAGADSWKVIDNTIRTKSFRFLFVASNSSIHKDGTLKELAVADKMKDKGDFIIPLRLDETPYSQFPPEIIRLKAIDFSSNWAEGLNELFDTLKKSSIPRNTELAYSAVLPFWYKTVSVDCTEPIDKNELYSSNLFSYELPEKVYIHVPDALSPIDTSILKFPTILDQGLLISFAADKSLDDVRIAKTETIYTEDFIAKPTYKLSDGSWLVSAIRPKIVQLLNDAFNRFMRSKGLGEYVFSGNRHAFYFDSTYPVRKLSGPRRAVSLAGVRKEYNWHFAIEGASSLFPQATFSITYHIVFSRDGVIVPVPRIQHSLRRSLGKDWYNRRWRDSILTAMLSLANDNENIINIPVCNHQVIRINAFPLTFISHKGYQEPKKDGVTDEPAIDVSSGA
jgi:hypothetical protein